MRVWTGRRARTHRPAFICISERLFSYADDMAHGGIHHDPADLDPAFAGVVADTMQALAAPSRVRILGRLHAGACSVNDLARRSAWSPRPSRTSCACCAISAS